MRRLIYVPIIHAAADMGRLGEVLGEASAKACGGATYDRLAASVQRMWEGLQARVLGLELPATGLKVYQDGLPVCGTELGIARRAAEQGSINYQLVLQLLDRGGELVGTEDPRLLVQEHVLLERYLETKGGGLKAASRYQAASKELLARRDAFVRRRLDQTLASGQTAIMFMGLEHRPDEGLPSSIAVHYLLHRLPLQRDFHLRLVAERSD